MDQIDLMRMGIESRFPVRLRDFEIWLRPLSCAETIQLAAEVSEEVSKKPVYQRNSITEHVIFSIKTLALASTSKPGVADYKLSEFVLQGLTPDELSYLFKEYCTGTDKINPALEKISTEKLLELVSLAKKNPTVLIEFSFREVVECCRYLLETSQQGNAVGG